MLAHWWRKSSTYWCKHPNISFAKRMKSSSKCWSQYGTTFAWIAIVVTIPQEKMIHETRSAQVKINNDYVYQSVSTICYKHNIHLLSWWLERCIERTCVCLCRTWNPTFLAMETKKSKLHHVGHSLSPMNTSK